MNEPCPKAGGGVHRWLLGEGNRLRLRGLSPQAVGDALHRATRGCGRPVPPREIADAIRTAFASGYPMDGNRRVSNISLPPPAPTWPARDERRIRELVADGGGLVDLWELSPIRLESNEPQTEAIVDLLFGTDALLCCGKSSYTFATKPRADWRGELASLQFIVPSPMSALTGTTKDGRISAHCLDNTAPRRFLVVEQDAGTLDEQAVVLLHLRTTAPLVLVVHSGSKSLHGWFYAQGQPEDRLRRWFGYCVTLGGDAATWTRSQFVRMPDGTRDNARQAVYYLDFSPLSHARHA